MKELYIQDLSSKVGERLKESFYLADVKLSGHEDNQWLTLILVDRTGRTYGKIWGEYIRPEYESYKGQVVTVSGLVECFRGQYGLKVEELSPVSEAELADYAVVPDKSVTDMEREELHAWIDSVNDGALKALLNKIYSPGRIEKFLRMPASTDLYAAYAGGWIANPLAGVRLCSALAEAEAHYLMGNSPIDMDLLISGALLRDVGKIAAFDEAVIDWRLSPRAILVGCTVDGATFVQASNQLLGEKKVADLTELLHIIASCHGVDVKPRTKEAIIVSNADRMAAASAAYDTAVGDKKTSGDMVYSAFLKYDVMRRRGNNAHQQEKH